MMKIFRTIFVAAVMSLTIPNVSLAFSQTFTNGQSGTITIPAGVTTVTFNAQGGNGGSGTGSSNASSGVGGGGGSAFAYSNSIGWVLYVAGGGGGASRPGVAGSGGQGGSTSGIGVGLGGANAGFVSPLATPGNLNGYGGNGASGGLGGAPGNSGGSYTPGFGGNGGGGGWATNGGNGGSLGGGGGAGYGGGGGGNATSGRGGAWGGGGGGGSSYLHPSLIASGAGMTIPVSVVGSSIYLQSGSGGLGYLGLSLNAGGPGIITISWVDPPVAGTINVSSNISSSWTITGPTTITGSGTSQSSPSQPVGIYTITWDAVPNYITPTSQSLTLTSGGTITFSGTYTALASCTLPWGGSITSGSSLTAYQLPSVTSPTTCASISQTRICNNGTLSGTYTNQSCVVNPPASCTLPWGGSIASGNSVTAYQAVSVVAPATCTSQSRTCTNGTLSGAYVSQSCVVIPAPIDGSCGTAATPQSAKPTTNLCATGNASSVIPASGNGPWSWTCVGSNGGVTVSCVAPYVNASGATCPNAVCESAKGENPITCPQDCRVKYKTF